MKAAMNPETLTALQQSIAKWERNSEAKTPDDASTGASSCPLCQLFYYELSCNGCPVRAASGAPFCQNTPYELAWEAHDRWKWSSDTKKAAKAFRSAARAEVEFLKSLLPESSA